MNEPIALECNSSDATRYSSFKWKGIPTIQVPIHSPRTYPSCSKYGKSLQNSEEFDIYDNFIF